MILPTYMFAYTLLTYLILHRNVYLGFGLYFYLFNSYSFHWVMYFYAVTSAFMVIWGGLTIKDIDHLSLTEIQDLNKKAEVSGIIHINKDEAKEKEDVLEGNLKVIEVKVENSRVRKRSVLQDWKKVSQAINVR